MPFDNPIETDSVLKNLVDARALIEDRRHHMVGGFRVQGATGTRRCSLEALHETLTGKSWLDDVDARTDTQRSREYGLLTDAATRGEICTENNYGGHAGALQMYDRAIAARRDELGRA